MCTIPCGNTGLPAYVRGAAAGRESAGAAAEPTSVSSTTTTTRQDLMALERKSRSIFPDNRHSGRVSLSAMRFALLLALLASTAAADAPKITKAVALDFDLVDNGTSFVLQDSAFAVTFPKHPKVKVEAKTSASGIALSPLTAVATIDEDFYVLVVLPIPKDVPYDVDKGMSGTRDGALGNISGTIVSESATTLGGIAKARKTVATAVVGGKTLRVDMIVAWDDTHRCLIAIFTATTATDSTAIARAFLGSFKFNKAGKAPPAG